MNINPIKTEADYKESLVEIKDLFEAAPDTPEGDRLEVLMALVEAYERQHYPFELPEPIAAIEYYMDCKGLSEADLEPYIGSRSQVCAVLQRREPLTIDMIRRLYQGLQIPVDVLMQSMIQEWDKPASDAPVGEYEYATPARQLLPASSQPIEAGVL